MRQRKVYKVALFYPVETHTGMREFRKDFRSGISKDVAAKFAEWWAKSRNIEIFRIVR